MNTDAWDLQEGNGPVIATAIHAGHELRPEVAERMALSDEKRFMEEDPYTDGWVDVADTRLVVRRSRFEVDMNRPREGAVYATPDQSWGLDVWRSPLPGDVKGRSLDLYDGFYADLERLLRAVEREHGSFVLYDLHSYNHRRSGPDAPPEDPAGNPDVNLGTGSLDRPRWAGLVDRFLEDLRGQDVEGRRLDVRENVRFRGGHMSRWVHERFPDTGCVLAIEVKKFFCDEHTGELHVSTHKAVHEALAATVPGVREERERR